MSLDTELLSALGTLAHNRSFTAQEFREYTGRKPSELRKLVAQGVLAKDSARYWPTREGWASIESAYAE